MKQITMDYDIYLNDLKNERDNGVSTGMYIILAHLRDGNRFYTSGYQEDPECKELVKEIMNLFNQQKAIA